MKMIDKNLVKPLKGFFLSFCFVGLLQYSAYAESKEDKTAVRSFTQKANRIYNFMGTKPLIVGVSTDSISPSGVAYKLSQAEVLDSSMNVERTNSLITPYLGYLTITYRLEFNKTCGDLPDKKGYSTYAKAVADKNNCFQTTESQIRKAKITFAYQSNRWIFKDASQLGSSDLNDFPDYVLLEAFGHWGDRAKENAKWEKLIN
jgi:hypothetical protein